MPRSLLLVLLVAPLLVVEAQMPTQLGSPNAKVLGRLSLKNNSGVWFGEGDQYPLNVWEAYDAPDTLPNCSAHKDVFTYEHYAPTDPHYTIIYVDSATGQASMVTAGHKRTTLYKIVRVRGDILTREAVGTGVETCQFWKPYVDLRTGDLKVQVINKNEWTKQANGTVTRSSLNCFVKGNERAGCYPQSSTKVHSVNVATYICKNGECATFAPIYAVEEHH